MRNTGALQNARNGRHCTSSPAWHGGTVLAIPDITGAELPRASVDNGKAGRADEWSELCVENFITDAEFATPPGCQSEIETAAGALVTEDCDASEASERVAGKLGGKGIRRHKEMRASERLVVFAGRQVARTKKQVIAPLAAAMGKVHEGDPGPGREIECCNPGAF